MRVLASLLAILLGSLAVTYLNTWIALPGQALRLFGLDLRSIDEFLPIARYFIAVLCYGIPAIVGSFAMVPQSKGAAAGLIGAILASVVVFTLPSQPINNLALMLSELVAIPASALIALAVLGKARRFSGLSVVFIVAAFAALMLYALSTYFDATDVSTEIAKGYLIYSYQWAVATWIWTASYLWSDREHLKSQPSAVLVWLGFATAPVLFGAIFQLTPW